MSNGAGKGGRYRKVDRKKWDKGWEPLEKKEGDKDDEKEKNNNR